MPPKIKGEASYVPRDTPPLIRDPGSDPKSSWGSPPLHSLLEKLGEAEV